MELQQRQLIKNYIDLILFRWKLITACILLALTLGTLFYLRKPKVYQSFALLSYEQQQINPARMAPEEQGGDRLRDTVSTLGQLVLSRTNLVKIIKQFSLYEEARQQLPIEDVIEIMRQKIIIAPSARGDTFTVSYEGVDPVSVQKVTNAVASQFIEENLKYREERAAETSKYTEDELSMAKVVLDEKEQAMRDYKLKHYNEMPEQRESNLARLSSLFEQNQGIQDSIQDLERTKVLVQEQIAIRQQILNSSYALEAAASTAPSAATGQTLSPYDRLAQMRTYLASLLNRYTERHPEVRRTKQQIAQLEKELGRGDQQAQTTQSSGAGQRVVDPELQELRLQLKEINLNMKGLRRDQQRIPEEIAKYQKWIAAAPVREAEWSTLTRDYNELRRHYDYLVAQNLQAESVEHLEHKQKGSKFKIVDPARLPDKPFKPNFLTLIMIALAGGLGVSVGLTLVLDFMDTSLKDVVEVEEYLGVPVACAVPYVERSNEMRKEKILSIIYITIFLLYGAALCASLGYLWLQGKIIL